MLDAIGLAISGGCILLAIVWTILVPTQRHVDRLRAEIGLHEQLADAHKKHIDALQRTIQAQAEQVTLLKTALPLPPSAGHE